MQKKIVCFLILSFILTGFFVNGQQSAVIQAYIEKFREAAINEMIRSGVPASITLAQGIHETSAGTSPLVLKSNNHFGIKCKSNWTGPSVSHTDDAPNECFRKYNSAEESYVDHSDFLKRSSRYAFLFDLNPEDYKGWANGLKKAGYATNPKYPLLLIKLIEDYNLQDYTLIALGKKQNSPLVLVKNETPVSVTPALVTVPPKTYPTGIFKINETKVIFARSGTSLFAIASEHNISLARLFEFNDMDEQEALGQDQLIYLQRKRKTGKQEFHTVQSGETLYDIAREQAIRLESLLEYNHLNGVMQPAVGERLYLKEKAPAAPKLLTNALTYHNVSESSNNSR